MPYAYIRTMCDQTRIPTGNRDNMQGNVQSVVMFHDLTLESTTDSREKADSETWQ